MPDENTPASEQPTPSGLQVPSMDIDLPMSAKTAKNMAWVAWVLVLVGTVCGAIGALRMSFVPDWLSQVIGGISVVTMLVAAEIRRRLPAAADLNKAKEPS